MYTDTRVHAYTHVNTCKHINAQADTYHAQTCTYIYMTHVPQLPPSQIYLVTLLFIFFIALTEYVFILFKCAVFVFFNWM